MGQSAEGEIPSQPDILQRPTQPIPSLGRGFKWAGKWAPLSFIGSHILNLTWHLSKPDHCCSKVLRKEENHKPSLRSCVGNCALTSLKLEWGRGYIGPVQRTGVWGGVGGKTEQPWPYYQHQGSLPQLQMKAQLPTGLSMAMTRVGRRGTPGPGLAGASQSWQ